MIDGPFRTFTYDNGRLIVKRDGMYYIYAQVFYEHYLTNAPTYHSRVALTVNGTAFGLMEKGGDGLRAIYGSMYTGGMVQLHKGDYISLVTDYESTLWMSVAHTFFGAYKSGKK